MESYYCGADAGPEGGPHKTQLHAGPSMQFPWVPPKWMQSLLHLFWVHLSPNLRTTGLQSPLFILSIDATSSANLKNKKYYQNNRKQRLWNRSKQQAAAAWWQLFVTQYLYMCIAAIGTGTYLTTSPWGQGSGELWWPSSWVSCWIERWCEGLIVLKWEQLVANCLTCG